MNFGKKKIDYICINVAEHPPEGITFGLLQPIFYL